MDKEKRKNLIYVAVLIVLIAVTFFLIFRNYDLAETMELLQTANKGWITLAVILNLTFVGIGAFNLKILLSTLGSKVSIVKAIKYVLVETYFCAVTPSASGGQPMEMLEMKRDGVALSKSTISLIVIAIAYKGALLIYALMMIAMIRTGIVDNLGALKWLFYLGIGMNLAAVIFMSLALFCGDIFRKLLVNIVNFVNSIHELKKYDKHINDINKVMKNYREGAAYILKHRKVFYMVLISTFLQRTCRFAVTYAVYRAFGLSGTSFAWIILLQAIVNVSADMIPIPGAVGVSENCYLNAFSEVFGKKLVLPSMVLSRGISFYGLVLLSGVLVVFLQLKSVAEVKGEK